MAHRSDAASLLDELRQDTELDSELERDALARVEQRLRLRVIEGSQREPEAPRSRIARTGRTSWWRGVRGGMAAALLVGSALGAGGHAAVSFLVSPGVTANVTPPAGKDGKVPHAIGRGERYRRASEGSGATKLEAAATPS